MSETHNLFICHRHEDDELVAGFKTLLAGRGVTIRDASITRDDPNRAQSADHIKTQILAPGINWAGTIVVIITPDTKNHEWVTWEIDYANKKDKPIVGVWAPNSKGCEVPESLERYAESIVGWDPAKILQAINGSRIFDGSDGRPRGPQPISRLGC